MLRRLALCALVFTLGGCGDGNEERAELKTYVDKMQQFEGMNRQVADFITRLDQPSYEIAATDLQEARQLIATYLAQIEKLPSVDIAYRELRVAHDLYGRKLLEARDLAAETGQDLKRERGNVAMGMRYIEKMTKLHYKALDVLWLHTDQAGDLPLKWPE